MIIGAMDLSDRHSLGTSANVPQQAKNRAYIMDAHFTSYNKCSMPCVGKRQLPQGGTSLPSRYIVLMAQVRGAHTQHTCIER